MTSAERKAVGFFALLAAAGAGARALGIGDRDARRAPSAEDRLALQHQLEAVDSAHAHGHRGRAGARGRTRRSRRGGSAAGDESGGTVRPEASAAATPRAAPVIVGPSGPTDVNRADSAALVALPGIGPALAGRILADRAAHGPYGSLAELGRVRGIGVGVERRLSALVTFGGAPAGAVTFTESGRPSSGSGLRAGAHRRARVAAAPVGAGSWPAP